MNNIEELADDAIVVLKKLISTKSYSGAEDKTADLLENILKEYGFNPQREKNNVYVRAGERNPQKPTLLLNAHHDTVEASSKWENNPFKPTMKDGKLIGLGSNDDGASLVSLLATFVYLSKKQQPYNLLYLASAEEEITGENGVPIVLPLLGEIDLGIVGEPTSMNMAVAERGLLVLDCKAHGKTGHAARSEGENAIYNAMKDIEWFRNFEFEKKSDVLGKINMTVTQIKAGNQHNVVPDECRFVVDVRPNEHYSIKEVLEIIRQNVKSEVRPRSLKWTTSGISNDHIIVKKAEEIGIKTYGSQTMSDQVNMDFPTVKIGPGDTRRSHTADEYVYPDEIREGIKLYIKLLDGLEL